MRWKISASAPKPCRAARARNSFDRRVLAPYGPIEEFSAKERLGPPVEGPLDADLDVWSGVVPLTLVRGEPIPAYA
jgi:uncharacterized protein